MACERRFDPEVRSVQVTPDERGIAPAHAPRGYCGTQLSMSEIGLRHDHESRGVTIQTMHDPCSVSLTPLLGASKS